MHPCCFLHFYYPPPLLPHTCHKCFLCLLLNCCSANPSVSAILLDSVYKHSVQFSSVQSLSGVQLFANPWTPAHQASLSITSSWSLLKPMPIKSVMPPNHLILLSPSPTFNLSQLPGAGILHIECSTFHSIIFRDLEWLNWNSITAGSQREELRP